MTDSHASGSLGDSVIRQLTADERYKQALDSVKDDEARRQIDLTVKTFVEEMARSFEGLRSSLQDPAVRAKFEERFRRR